jgi:hypothetical protein
MTTLLPMYVHPLDDPVGWRALTGYAGEVTVIVNVHDGPGEYPNSSYEEVTAALRLAGVDMIGYVDLDYGARPAGDVWRDVVDWELRYPVSGLFFDRVAADREGLAQVAHVVRSVSRPVVLNPGTRPDAGYADLAATVCTFEGGWRQYRAAASSVDWPNAAHLVYGVPRGELDEATALLRRRVSSGLVSDLDGPNPYHGLPAGLRGKAGVA